ncbi:MAG: hypothetical protein HFE51_06935 [Clostridia bacterium]|nr:hypothetical protein [Clostridia bacterium]
MRLKMDLDGIIVELNIQQYVKKENRTSDECDYWCKVDFSFSSQLWLNYNKENDEVFLSYEVDDLTEALDKLLNNKLCAPTTIELIEPDFCFELTPKEDLRNNPQILYIQPGYEIADISMEWRVFFWHDGLTANYLTVTLDRTDIKNLRDYLFLVTGKYNECTPEIVEMEKNGILY